MKRGQIQYPKIDVDWKNDTVAPNTLKLNVTTMAPIKTENITAKK